MSYRAYCEYINCNGVELYTVVCLPSESGSYPTVINRTPYFDTERLLSDEENCQRRLEGNAPFLDAGYAVVSQHCRGTGKSGGECVPYIYEREDSLALQEWIRRQPFYNGELFLVGSSYCASVHLVTAPFASDIKGAIFEVQDSERYNCNYRNGLFKMGLHGGWYVGMYKKKQGLTKSFTRDTYRMLPLSDFSRTVFGESAEDFDEILRHPNKTDPFWNTRFGGGEASGATEHADIPMLFITGFYDIYTGGVFNMWRSLDEETRSKSALAVHPFDHSGTPDGQPIEFEGGVLATAFDNFRVRWLDSVRGRCEPPFARGEVTYYKLFDNKWCTDVFSHTGASVRFSLGDECVSYKYNPYNPASFNGGLSTNFGGCAWQAEPNSRYDIISVFTPDFEEDTFVKGRMKAVLTVSSDCDDTCFYMRLSLVKEDGCFGLRDDINQISNFDINYKPGGFIEMNFSFDEHAFVVKKGEKIRIDISSSAFPHYVPHTNNRGLFSAQKLARVATNTVDLKKSFIEIPISNE